MLHGILTDELATIYDFVKFPVAASPNTET